MRPLELIANTPKKKGGTTTAIATETALSCLFRLGAQHGTYAEIGVIRRRHLIDGPTMAPAQLIEIAPEFGFKAERLRLDWHAFQTRAFTHPLLLILSNTNVVILMGVRRDGVEEAAISDPLFRDGSVFFLPRADLERVWTGDALLVTPMPASSEETKFGFSWFTSKLFAERRLMLDVVAGALVMHLIALSVPIFFQLLVDKVVPN